jgi:hypothetical protein
MPASVLPLLLLPSLLSAEEMAWSQAAQAKHYMRTRTNLKHSLLMHGGTGDTFLRAGTLPHADSAADVALPFCIIKPVENDTEHPDTMENHVIELHYELPNSRTILHEGGQGGTVSTIVCKGDLPLSCSSNQMTAQDQAREVEELAKQVRVSDAQACPTCTCVQDTSKPLDFGYNKAFWEFMKPRCSPVAKLRILHIGISLGAFVTYVHDNCAGSTNHIIDIDPRIVKLAKQFFGATWSADGEYIEGCDTGVKQIADTVEGQDGSHRYDYIVLDTYDQDSKVPEVCRNEAFAKNVFRLLKSGGFLLANLWYPEEWGKFFNQTSVETRHLGSTAYAYKAPEASVRSPEASVWSSGAGLSPLVRVWATLGVAVMANAMARSESAI